jgi:hypothetical protein
LSFQFLNLLCGVEAAKVSHDLSLCSPPLSVTLNSNYWVISLLQRAGSVKVMAFDEIFPGAKLCAVLKKVDYRTFHIQRIL